MPLSDEQLELTILLDELRDWGYKVSKRARCGWLIESKDLACFLYHRDGVFEDAVVLSIRETMKTNHDSIHSVRDYLLDEVRDFLPEEVK